MVDLSKSYEVPAKLGGTTWFARIVAGPLRRWLGVAASAIAREWRIRRDTHRLLEAEPRLLKDLGIARSDVERLVRRGRDAR
jgi:uncharacterized protein YjiS (DUF1127 family)